MALRKDTKDFLRKMSEDFEKENLFKDKQRMEAYFRRLEEERKRKEFTNLVIRCYDIFIITIGASFLFL